MKNETREQLEQLLGRLRDWKVTVPERAARFRAVGLELEEQIQKALSFWSSLWINQDEARRLQQRVDRLGKIAEPLADLIRRTDLLKDDVARLAEDARLEDTELTDWFHGRCREWLATLGRIAETSERETDVRRDELTFAETESEVRRHHEAVRRWRDAERVLGLVQGLRATPLAGQLPDLRRRLYTGGATPEWLDELKALIQPLHVVVNRIQDPPPELAGIAELLGELRRWSEALGGLADEQIQKLRERQFKAVEWDSAEVQKFADEARALRTALLEEAARIRTDRLKKQGDELSVLHLAYGNAGALQRAFDRLDRAVITDPIEFRGWEEELDRFRNSFLADAQACIGELQTRLRDMIAEIRKQLAELSARPLSTAVADAVVLRREEVEALPRVSEVEPVLSQLRTVNAAAHAIEGLRRQAERELLDVEQEQAGLAGRNERLQGEVRQLKGSKVDIPDLTERIAALSQGSPEGSLEERRRQAADLERELAAFEERFVAYCRGILEKQLAEIEKARRILQRAGAAVSAFEPPDIPADAIPAHAVRAVVEAKRHSQTLLVIARETRDHLDSRRAQVRVEIKKLRAGGLAPGDRQDAEHFLSALAKGAAVDNGKLPERIEALTTLLEMCDLFVSRLLQPEREAHARFTDLHQAFRRFNNEQLSGYCREAVHRVRSLLFGIPAQPPRWSAVRPQIEAAFALFKRVRTYAQRRAAEELEGAAEDIRRIVQEGCDSSGELARLLAELDALGHDSLPPAPLRMRVVNASKRRR